MEGIQGLSLSLLLFVDYLPPPPPEMNKCPPKRDHFKTKFHLPSINFQGDLWVFGVGVLESKRQRSNFCWYLIHCDKSVEYINCEKTMVSVSKVSHLMRLFHSETCLPQRKKTYGPFIQQTTWCGQEPHKPSAMKNVSSGEVSNSSSPWPIPLYWYMSMRTFGWNLS